MQTSYQDNIEGPAFNLLKYLGEELNIL